MNGGRLIFPIGKRAPSEGFSVRLRLLLLALTLTPSLALATAAEPVLRNVEKRS